VRVLVVEDNERLAAAIAETLTQVRMAPVLVANGQHADQMLEEARGFGRHFDAIVLDLSLPGMDGIQVLKRLRAAGDMTPVLILSARSAAEHRVAGLRHGADDYLAKPFDNDEMVARIRSITRRRQEWSSLRPQCVNLVFDASAGFFTVRHEDGSEQALILAPKAQLVLEALFRRQGVPVNKELLTNIEADGSSVEAIDIQVSRLRKKLMEAGAQVSIRTLYGVGYLLEASTVAQPG